MVRRRTRDVRCLRPRPTLPVDIPMVLRSGRDHRLVFHVQIGRARDRGRCHSRILDPRQDRSGRGGISSRSTRAPNTSDQRRRRHSDFCFHGRRCRSTLPRHRRRSHRTGCPRRHRRTGHRQTSRHPSFRLGHRDIHPSVAGEGNRLARCLRDRDSRRYRLHCRIAHRELGYKSDYETLESAKGAILAASLVAALLAAVVLILRGKHYPAWLPSRTSMRTMTAFPTSTKTRATARPATPRGQQIRRSDSLSGHAHSSQ